MLNIQTFTFNPFAENTYILYSSDKNAYLIDPGNALKHETQQLFDFIETHGLNIKNILLTHAHIDHVLGLQKAYDTYKVPVLMHAKDQVILDANPMTAQKYGFSFHAFEGEITYLEEGDQLEIDQETLDILHLPGHSPGSIGFYNAKQDWIISGDVLFQGSIGRTDLFMGSHSQLIESIKTKLLILEDNTQVFSGHGASTNIGFEKQYNPFLN